MRWSALFVSGVSLASCTGGVSSQSGGTVAAKPSEVPAVPRPSAPPSTPHLGPIDLGAPSLDLAALFPHDKVSHEDAATGEGDMPATPEQLTVHRAGLDGDEGDAAVVVSIDGGRASRVEVFAPGIATPAGVEVNAPIAAVVKAAPAVTCDWGGPQRGILCAGTGGLTYQVGGPWNHDSEVSVSALDPSSTVAGIIYDWPKGTGPKVAVALALPGKCKAFPGSDEGDEVAHPDLDGDGTPDPIYAEGADESSTDYEVFIRRGNCGYSVGEIMLYTSNSVMDDVDGPDKPMTWTFRGAHAHHHGLADLEGENGQRFHFDGKKYVAK